MTARALKVLISAYACSPYRGSEFAVGWGLVEHLAKRHELWVFTEEEKCQADILRYISEHPSFAARVHFIFVKKHRRRTLRKLWPPSYYWYYRRWHLQVLSQAAELHREIEFDLAHQLTMVGYREPGYLWQLPIPFVWGPIGGMGRLPWNFIGALGFKGGIYYAAYNVINFFHERFLPRPQLAAKRAKSGLITATASDQHGVRTFWGCESTLMPEVGLPPSELAPPRKRAPDEPLEIIWSGQHTPGKALNIGLAALAQLGADVSWRLTVLGKGQMTEKWVRLAMQLGIASHCRFLGWLPRDEALGAMRKGHVLLITSLRDLTSTVTVEALSQALPVVCLDHCGFANVVDATCGLKVKVTTPRETSAGLAEALKYVAANEKFRHDLSIGARNRASKFSWEKKAEVVNAIYEQRLKDRQL